MYSLLTLVAVMTCVEITVADFASDMIYAHNKLRSNHENTTALQWNDTLAADAQVWAKRLSNRQKSKYSGLGENIHLGSSNDVARTVLMWYSELNYYDFDDPDWTEGDRDFAQLIWRSSTTFGCGIKKNKTMYTYAVFFIVCRYDPPGNTGGQVDENVGYFKDVDDIPSSIGDLRP